MSRSAWGKKHLIVVVLLAVPLAGVAWAAIPDSDGVISGCYDKNGVLRVIDSEAGETCKKGESPLSWNQQGVPGGLSSLRVTDGFASVGSSNYITVATLSLPAGKYHVTGNVSAQNQTSGDAVISCNVLSSSGPPVDATTETVPAPQAVASVASMAFDGGADLPSGGTVHVECINGAANPSTIATNARLSATTVGSIS